MFVLMLTSILKYSEGCSFDKLENYSLEESHAYSLKSAGKSKKIHLIIRKLAST